PSTSYALDFFSGPSAGQASSFVGTATATTDSSGVATFDVTFNGGTPLGAIASATATDPSGNTSELSTSTVVTPRNTPPTANAGGPYSFNEGAPVTLDASASSDPDGDPLTYSWTINGHANAASGVKPTLSWSQLQALGVGEEGSFSVSVTVSD